MTKPSVLRSICYFGIFLGLILSVVPLSAQITNVAADQTPPIEGAGHDYIKMLNETVNPATGAVSIRINVPVPPSRGFSVPFSIGYDSNAALHVVGGYYTDNRGYLGQGGWTYLVPNLTAMYGDIPYIWEGAGVQCRYYYDYMLTDLQGGSHALGLSAVEPQNGNPGDCSPEADVLLPGPSVTYGADEKVQAVTTGLAVGNFNFPPVTVADVDGTTYYFPSPGSAETPVGLLPSSIEDRNGNKALFTTGSNGGFTVTDSTGRAAIRTSSFGNPTDTITVSGLPNSYSVTWAAGPHPGLSPTDTIIDLGQNNKCSPGGAGSMPFQEITKIGLPNGQQYSFIYDPTTTLLQRVTYPSGGYIRYVWQLVQQSSYNVFTGQATQIPGPNCEEIYASYALQNRYVSFNGTTEALEQDFSYTSTWTTNGWEYWTNKQTTVTTKDNVRGTSYATVYSYTPFYQPAQPNDLSVVEPVGFPVESQIAYYSDATEHTLLRTVTKTYSDPALPPTETDTLDDAASHPTSETNPVYSCVGLKVNNICRLAVFTDEYNYDYGSGAPGTLLKHTHVDYASFAATPLFPSEASILDRPSDMIVCQSATCTTSNEIAETDYLYDGQAVSSVSSATEHDETNYSSSYNVRGNATTKTVKCLQSGCSNPVTTYTYDETGQVSTVKDPCGNGTCSDMTGSTHSTTYSYANSYTVLSNGSNVSYPPSGNTNAYLTQLTNPLGQIEKFTYDYNSGELTVSQDQNDINASRPGTTYIYNDPFARPTQVNYPDGGQTELKYSDAAPKPTVTSCQLINGTTGATCTATPFPAGWKTGVSTMDGMGHLVQAELVSDPDGPTFTATTYYDGTGKPYQGYNPTRCSTPATNCGTEATWGYTTNTYDALGRTLNVGEPDGSAVTTSYSGNCTTVTDEAGNARQSCADGLGRMTKVLEDPGSSPHLNYETDYSYDALNNMLSVTQNGSNSANARNRSFQYDSLSRLTQAVNPESGTITYNYDVNGNVSTKVAPKPGQTGTMQSTTTYSYDVLSRLTEKSYANPYNSIDQYAYDGATLTCGGVNPPSLSGATNLIGRRSAMCGGLSGSSFSYDPMGRLAVEDRNNKGTTSAVTYKASYLYYEDGSLKQITYPSTDVVTYTPGGAGRPIGVSDSSTDYVASGTGAARATYAPQGAIAGMVNGYATNFPTGIVTSNLYNDRLQPILLSASLSSGAIFSLCYDFHLHQAISSGPCSFSAYTSGDNGSVFQILNKVDSTRSAAYLYDPLNRIAQAYTVTTSTNCWAETYASVATAPGVLPPVANFGIDPWGNLTQRSGVTGMGSCMTEGSLGATASTNNQLSIMSYDAAGNVLNDGNGNQPTYDDRNRISTDAGYTYSYDADDVRMEKANGSTGTMYWPGPGGETLAETSLTGTINEEYIYFNGARIARVDRPTGTPHYYFSNNVGSHTLVTNATGVCEQDIDYYPYGGVIKDYCPVVVQHYKFTGKERDTESGLDMFGARYYGSSLGRFMTPDWAAKPVTVPYASFGNPQSLNLYSYVDNNPTTTRDPDGHGPPCGATGIFDGVKNCNPDRAQNKSWWQKLAGVFYAKGSVGVAVEVGLEAHIGKAKSPLKVGGKIGADVKSTMTVTTEGTTVSATKEAQAAGNIGPIVIGPQTSTENVTVKNGEPLANHEVEKSSSLVWGTEKAEATVSKGDFGVGAEVDAGVLVVGFEVGVDFDKVRDLFNPH